jgi:hypothetical protein
MDGTGLQLGLVAAAADRCGLRFERTGPLDLAFMRGIHEGLGIQ